MGVIKLGNVRIKVDQSLPYPHMLAHHRLGGIAQLMMAFAFARQLRKFPRRLGNGSCE